MSLLSGANRLLRYRYYKDLAPTEPVLALLNQAYKRITFFKSPLEF